MIHPAEWATHTVGDLFDITAGKALSEARRHGPTQVPFLRTANVLWDRVDVREMDHMAYTDEDLESRILRSGDLLVCEGGEIGRSAIWRGEIGRCGFQNHVHRLRVKAAWEGRLEPEFVMFYLWAGFTRLGLYEGAGNKTTIPNLSRNKLAALPVVLPSYSEQRCIGELLRAVRDNIRSMDQQLAALAELKCATMAHLFTHGTRGEALKETEIGAVPESWGVVPMSRVLTQAQYGLSLRGQRAGAYPILRMNCQLDGKTIFRDLQFVDLEVRVYDSFRLHDGNLLFNRTNSYELVGRTSLVEGERPAVFASYLIRLGIDRAQISPRFLNYYLGLVSTQVALKSIASRGVSQANISASKLRDFLIPLPPTLDGQEEIVARILAIDECIEVNTAKLNRLQELFQSLLDGLMTGALSVPALSELPQIEVAGVS